MRLILVHICRDNLPKYGRAITKLLFGMYLLQVLVPVS